MFSPPRAMTVESFPTITRRANFALGEMEGAVTFNEERQIISGMRVKETAGVLLLSKRMMQPSLLAWYIVQN